MKVTYRVYNKERSELWSVSNEDSMQELVDFLKYLDKEGKGYVVTKCVEEDVTVASLLQPKKDSPQKVAKTPRLDDSQLIDMVIGLFL